MIKKKERVRVGERQSGFVYFDEKETERGKGDFRVRTDRMLLIQNGRGVGEFNSSCQSWAGGCQSGGGFRVWGFTARERSFSLETTAELQASIKEKP